MSMELTKERFLQLISLVQAWELRDVQNALSIELHLRNNGETIESLRELFKDNETLKLKRPRRTNEEKRLRKELLRSERFGKVGK